MGRKFGGMKFNKQKAAKILDDSVSQTIQQKKKGNFFKRLGKSVLYNILPTAVSFVPGGTLAKSVAGAAIHAIADKHLDNAQKLNKGAVNLQAKYQTKIYRATSKAELRRTMKDFEEEISLVK